MRNSRRPRHASGICRWPRASSFTHKTRASTVSSTGRTLWVGASQPHQFECSRWANCANCSVNVNPSLNPGFTFFKSGPAPLEAKFTRDTRPTSPSTTKPVSKFKRVAQKIQRHQENVTVTQTDTLRRERYQPRARFQMGQGPELRSENAFDLLPTMLFDTFRRLQSTTRNGFVVTECVGSSGDHPNPTLKLPTPSKNSNKLENKKPRHGHLLHDRFVVKISKTATSTSTSTEFCKKEVDKLKKMKILNCPNLQSFKETLEKTTSLTFEKFRKTTEAVG